MISKDTIHHWQERLVKGRTETWLKAAIILIALSLIVLALTVNNKWILAAILLYEVLP